MNLTWAAVGALVGLLAGGSLRGTVYRHSVPHGEPERTTCASCDRPVARLLVRPRCRHCRGRLGTPLVLELVTAAVLAVLLGRFGAQYDTAAFAFLGVLGVALATVDVAVQRLPDRLTLPAYPIAVALFAAAAIAGHQPDALLRALLGGLALAGGYLVLALIRPGQLGTGDIKLAGLVGMALAWLGWPILIVGATLGFVLLAASSLVLLAARRITLGSAISFGPFMLTGALLATVL